MVAGIAMLICAWAALAWTVSRSRLLLLMVGVTGFLLLVGSRGMGRNAKWAIGLMVLLGVGGFVFSDTDLKRRLVEASWNNHGVVDFRVLIWRDALTMIADSPWGGVGADEFGAVFPQYRELASVHNEADTVHPESDWLWVAAEMGVPAMLLLIGVVSGCFWMSWRSLKDGKGRALRAGFLMGALMLPIHGLFEVPGHRLPLLMIALVLWGLSLGPHLGSGFLKAELSRSQARHWALRAFGLLIIGAGAYLLSWESMGLRAPVMVRDQHLREEVERRLALDKALAAEASQAGLEYLPDESDDPIVGAFGLIEETLEVVPMKRSLWHLRGQLSALYDTRVPLLERSFVIERALNPFWVEGPMRQGEVAEGFQKNLAMEAWSEAEERAIRLETLDPETRWSAEEVRARRDRSYKRAGWDQ